VGFPHFRLGSVFVNAVPAPGVSPTVTRKVLSLVNVTQILAVAALFAGALSGGLQAQQTPQSTTPAKQADGRRDGGPGRGGPPGETVYAWWKDPQTVKDLGLTAVQVGKIDKLYEARRIKIAPKVEEYNKLKAELDRLFAGRTAKADEIEDQARRLSYPSQEIIVSRTRMLYEMSKVLTAEQNEKFGRIERERRERERGRGPGPGGNPAPR
jgi:Spy/CpxP family protein refolding chaperone